MGKLHSSVTLSCQEQLFYTLQSNEKMKGAPAGFIHTAVKKCD